MCGIGFSVYFTVGLLIGGYIGSLIFYLKPALPWPYLGLIWDIPFTSEVMMGFITCFSGNMFGSNLLPLSCTSGKHMPLDLACNLVWTKISLFFFAYIIKIRL